MKESKKKAVLYVRVNSTLEEAEEQLKELWAFAESKGFRITNSYYEVASGTAHVHNRTIWHMLEDAKKKKFNTVVMRDIARISRNPELATLVLEMLDEYGVKLVTQRSNPTVLELGASK
jgi:DNA invertase Pin-like site-specific DNA recombinase